jgi:6-phosphogluconolactonase
MSNDNKFAYLLSEMTGTITTLALDPKSGLLSEVSAVSMLPADSKLVAGIARLPQGEPPGPPHDASNDICASDLHLTPNGKFLYAAERTSSTISTFSVDGKTGKLTRLAGTPTEKWPRSFAIDPAGKYLIAAGQQSDTISVYSIDGAGALRLAAQAPTGKGPNWVEIVRL